MQPWLVALTTVFAPFIAFFIALVFFFRVPKAAQTGVILGGLLSLAGSVIMLAEGPAEPLRYLWFQSGDVHLQFGFLRDSLSLWFGAVVALITLCIEVYSLGYMAHDPAKSRFFAMLGLFGWAMLSFVYAVDLLQSFIFWELVGLASFFLIGFWYEKPSANAAAKKAFIMTRVGDVGLFIGVLLIVKHLGTYDILAILDPETGLAATVPEGRLTLIAVLLFTGIMGKSAQFPLHTWLPDAMEGPTPVSALLHSATMVAAGVFLFARLHPLFMASEACVFLVLVIATFTALLSSTIAMVESDIKKVLAYSSISQLGFMLMGLAAGSLFAGVFHLITHAFFKALLFLCAGSYIHHCDSNDMSVIGRRGGRKMRVTTLGLVIGGCALAGIPPLSGFFSKEEIFAGLSHHGQVLFTIGALGAAFLTAYYTFRMIFLVTIPAAEEPQSHGGGHHASDSPAVMLGPIVILAALAAIGGVLGGRLAEALGIEREHHGLLAMLPAMSAAGLGVVVAWVDFGRRASARRGFIAAIAPLDSLFRNQWYIDAFYRAVIVRANNVFSGWLYQIEQKGLDQSFDDLADTIISGGHRSARLQSGWVQHYSAIVIIMLSVAAFYFGLR